MNNKPYNVTILSLYPDLFPYFTSGIYKRALENNLWSLKIINIRDFSKGSYKKVDDKIFGGGAGMLLKADVVADAIDYAILNGASNNLVFPTPSAIVFNQSTAKDFATNYDGITFICGHFEGIDARLATFYNIKEISVGDYILSGGELSSAIILDSTLRLRDNVIKSESVEFESLKNGLLEHSQYTKPSVWRNLEVPSVLLSGNHKEIENWQLQNSKEKTKNTRPDLWNVYLEKNKNK